MINNKKQEKESEQSDPMSINSNKIKKGIPATKQTHILKEKNWYQRNQSIFKNLSERISLLVGDILTTEKIDYDSIDWRVKSQQSFEKKIRDNVVSQGKDMQDFAGIRIICYLISDIEKISVILRNNFQIHENLSSNKSDILGDQKVGYQSIHLVASLSKERLKLIENKQFTNLIFEIQIRTILQHAWAEIEHEKKYKFSGELPSGIPRRFNLISGMLEMIDNEFNQLSKMIDDYSNEVKSKTRTGKLDIPINYTSIMQYLLNKFGDKDGLFPYFRSVNLMKNVLEELKTLEIQTLKDLDEIIPNNIITIFKQKNFKPDFTDIIIDSLIIKFNDEYSQLALNYKWTWDPAEISVLKEYGISFDELAKNT